MIEVWEVDGSLDVVAELYQRSVPTKMSIHSSFKMDHMNAPVAFTASPKSGATLHHKSGLTLPLLIMPCPRTFVIVERMKKLKEMKVS